MNIFKRKPVKLTDKNSFIGDGRCRTCGHHQDLLTPLGKTVIEYAHRIKCEDCENNSWIVSVYG